MTKNNLPPQDADIAQYLADTTSDCALMLMKAARLGLPKTAKALANVNKIIGWEIAEKGLGK